MEELREDIKKHGMHTPVVVRPHPTVPDRFELATGERRLRSALALSLAQIPANIRALNDRQVKEMQWSENFRRANPNPLDEAKGLNNLLAYHKSVDSLARRINKPRAYVLTRLQLLNLTEPIQEMVHAGVFSLKDSIEIACLEGKSQAAFFEGRCKDWKQAKRFHIHDLSSALYPYRCDLSHAVFDIKNKDLVPEVGSCTRCPYNSACYQSLFPETDSHAFCSRQECYLKKTEMHLEAKVRTLVANQPPAVIVIDGNLDQTLQLILARIPESHAWPRHERIDVTIAYAPEQPDREDCSDEEEYLQLVADYQLEQETFRQSIMDGRLLQALCIRGYRLEMKYVCLEPTRYKESGNPTVITASAAAVKEAISAGTATQELLQGEITRLRNRELRSSELDQEKIQMDVHTKFSERIADVTVTPYLTKGDHLGMRLLVYHALDYQGKTKLHNFIPFDEDSKGQVGESLTSWLSGLTEEQLALMVRIAIHGKSEARLPTHPTGKTLFLTAEHIGVDVGGIRESRGKVTAARRERLSTRIASLEKNIAKLLIEETNVTS